MYVEMFELGCSVIVVYAEQSYTHSHVQFGTAPVCVYQSISVKFFLLVQNRS